VILRSRHFQLQDAKVYATFTIAYSSEQRMSVEAKTSLMVDVGAG
jgi:hypothetical protein